MFFAQFIKGKQYSEINGLKRFDDLITVEQFGLGRFIEGKRSASDIEAARRGLDKMKTVLSSGEYKVVILDEANVAVSCELFPLADLIELIDCRADGTLFHR